MKNFTVFVILTFFVLAACGAPATSAPEPTLSPAPTPTLVPPPTETPMPPVPSQPADPTQEALPVANDPLANTDWILQSLYGRSLLKDTTINLKFSEGFTYGEAGCNSYFKGDETMKYKISANGDLKIIFVRTGRLCPSPEGVMDQEKAYFKAIASVSGYNLTEDRLELKDGTGKIILVFTK